MNISFVTGWVSYLEESMLQRTNEYTCDDYMCVQKKPCILGNNYHSICCCISGLMYAFIDPVEGYNCPREKFVDVTKIAR